MASRKAPISPPDGAVKAAPPPAPPRKRFIEITIPIVDEIPDEYEWQVEVLEGGIETDVPLEET